MTADHSPPCHENNEHRVGGLCFRGQGNGMLPQAAYFGPAARRVKGPKSATERCHDGVASVAAVICRFPAINI